MDDDNLAVIELIYRLLIGYYYYACLIVSFALLGLTISLDAIEWPLYIPTCLSAKTFDSFARCVAS